MINFRNYVSTHSAHSPQGNFRFHPPVKLSRSTKCRTRLQLTASAMTASARPQCQRPMHRRTPRDSSGRISSRATFPMTLGTSLLRVSSKIVANLTSGGKTFTAFFVYWRLIFRGLMEYYLGSLLKILLCLWGTWISPNNALSNKPLSIFICFFNNNCLESYCKIHLRYFVMPWYIENLLENQNKTNLIFIVKFIYFISWCHNVFEI